MTRDARSQRAYNASKVYLLPGFDEHLLGYKDRSAVLAEEYAPKIVPGNNGMFLPTMVVAGRVIGIWKRRLKKSALDITLHPFIHLGASEESVMEAAKWYSDFMGLPLSSTKIMASSGLCTF